VIKEFKRKAGHDWCCDKCHQIILSGTQYKDQEIHCITSRANGVTSVIKHKRLCAICAGYIKEPKQYIFKEPEPVMDLTYNMKYWLVGVGYKPGKKDLYLIAKDWDGPEYHWKICLWTADGELLKTSNVRFV
jgi:hypothetical protein